jgi:hypothetical protein
MAVVAGGAGVALGVTPAVAATGAALAAVVRVLAGDSPAALTGAVLAPLLAVASLASSDAAPLREVIALAAAGWAVAELARPPGSATSPSAPPCHRSERSDLRVGALGVAALPAAAAGILDPSFVALLAIAGLRLVTAARPRAPRWALAVPTAGALALALAVLAGTAWPALGAAWFGAAAQTATPLQLAAALAAALGPLTAVAALAGLAALARPGFAEAGLAAAIAGALLVDLRAASVGPATIGLAALLAGLAIGRLAALIRLATGQAVVGATLGALLIAPPAWIAVAHRAAAPHIGQASR